MGVPGCRVAIGSLWAGKVSRPGTEAPERGVCVVCAVAGMASVDINNSVADPARGERTTR